MAHKVIPPSRPPTASNLAGNDFAAPPGFVLNPKASSLFNTPTNLAADVLPLAEKMIAALTFDVIADSVLNNVAVYLRESVQKNGIFFGSVVEKANGNFSAESRAGKYSVTYHPRTEDVKSISFTPDKANMAKLTDQAVTTATNGKLNNFAALQDAANANFTDPSRREVATAAKDIALLGKEWRLTFSADGKEIITLGGKKLAPDSAEFNFGQSLFDKINARINNDLGKKLLNYSDDPAPAPDAGDTQIVGSSVDLVKAAPTGASPHALAPGQLAQAPAVAQAANNPAPNPTGPGV